jgi:hypothetical protein
MPWLRLTDEHAVGAAPGSEGGTVVIDEEHDPRGARITLERDAKAAPAAITCGLYGWMMHTRRFSDTATARSEYEAMKIDLSALVARVPLEADPHRIDRARKELGALDQLRSDGDLLPAGRPGDQARGNRGLARQRAEGSASAGDRNLMTLSPQVSARLFVARGQHSPTDIAGS